MGIEARKYKTVKHFFFLLIKRLLLYDCVLIYFYFSLAIFDNFFVIKINERSYQNLKMSTLILNIFYPEPKTFYSITSIIYFVSIIF